MKLRHLKYALFIGICSMLLACTKKEPADILVKKSGTWDFSEAYYYYGALSSTKTGEITFESNGVGQLIIDTGVVVFKWAATNFTVMIEYEPKVYIYYSIKEESAKKIVLEDPVYYINPERSRVLTLTKK